MSKRVLVATFDRGEDLLEATRAARSRGLRVLDAYAPQAVHGLDEAMGLPPSRLTWVCGILGLFGAAFMLWFQAWTSAVDWPINVGGKPWNSLPAFVPVIFESMVLFAGVGTAIALFVVCRLYPGRPARPIVPGVTDDRFALVLEETDAAFDADEVAARLRGHGAVAVEERVLDGQSPPAADGAPSSGVGRKRLNAGLAVVLGVLLGLIALVGRDPSRPNVEFLPAMRRSAAYDALSANEQLPGGTTFQTPVAGTISRDEQVLHYEATEEDALRAGRELSNPFASDDPSALARGDFVFENFCASCHGRGGLGDGPVARRGYPPPPSMTTGDSTQMPDGQLFHIITYGRKNMPAHAGLLSPEDRWKAILHIRQLQAEVGSPKEAQP